jgi:asparagine synthase (glutamine-hydrolysing)
MSGLLDRPVKTFSIGSAEPRYDERPFAREVAKVFKTEHHELVLEPHHGELLEDLAWYQDEPLGDSSLVPTYMVCKLAAEHVKVVLSGDGGDEIFAGYDRYVVEERERSRDQLPRPLRSALAAVGRNLPEGTTGRNFLRHLGYEGPRRYANALTTFGLAEQAKLLEPAVAARVFQSNPVTAALGHLQSQGDWLSNLQFWDLQCYLPLDILPKVDRMSMAHSIEARPALLDHKLVEFAASVPPSLRMQGRTTKYLFKRAMRGILPDSVIDRQKRGFAMPLGHWLRGDWSAFVRDVLFSSVSRQRGMFQPQYIERMLKMNDSGRDMSMQIWQLVSFELWCRAFLDAQGQGRYRPRVLRDTALPVARASVAGAR